MDQQLHLTAYRRQRIHRDPSPLFVRQEWRAACGKEVARRRLLWGGLPLRYACCNELFEDWSLDETCACLRQLGYTGVELAPFTLAPDVRSLTAGDRRQVRRTVEKHGLQVAGLHWLLVGPQGLHMTHPDPDIRRATLAYFEALIDLCGELGGDVLVVGSPRQRNLLHHLDVTYDDAWAFARELFATCARRAEAAGVTVCIEPLPARVTDFITTAAEGARLVREVDHPRIRLVLDVHAMSAEAEPPARLLDRHLPVTAHVHVNDANGSEPGAGQTDFRHIMAVLARRAYTGWVSVEVFEVEPGPAALAAAAIGHLKQCLARRGADGPAALTKGE